MTGRLSNWLAKRRKAAMPLPAPTGAATHPYQGKVWTMEALHASEAKYRQSFERNLAGVFRADGNCKLIECNASFARMFGYASPAEVLAGNGFDELYVSAERRQQIVDKFWSDGGLSSFEAEMHHRNGSTVWVLGNAVLVADQTPPVIEGVFFDITDRRRAEEERDEFFELSHDLMVVADFHGRMHRLSRSWERLLGHSLEEIQARPGNYFLHPDDREGTREAIRRSVETKRPAIFENRFLTRSQEYCWLEWTVSPHPSRGLIYGTARDVTDRKRMEEELRQVHKMQAVGTLAGGVAHQFNNLLTVILGYGELLQRRSATDADLQGPLQAITTAARRAAGLTQNLLAFSRQQTLNPAIVNPNDVIASLALGLRQLLGASISLELALAEDLKPIRIDRISLEHVVMHLAENARDAMPDGGRLRLETKQCWVTTGMVPEIAPVERVRLSVIDSGRGMDAATQDRIFDPFFTTKPVGQGTGLGLAMVYGTLQQSGSSIHVKSQPGAGTQFDIDFPCWEEG